MPVLLSEESSLDDPIFLDETESLSTELNYFAEKVQATPLRGEVPSAKPAQLVDGLLRSVEPSDH